MTPEQLARKAKYAKQYRLLNKEKLDEYYREYYKEYHKKNYAEQSALHKKTGAYYCRGVVRYTIKQGRLLSLSENIVKCTDCENRAKVYDHRDYNKPLEVEAVCSSCNAKRGKAILKTGEPYKRKPRRKMCDIETLENV